MDHETIIKSIRALDKQITERVRDSLFNVSALPPETPGYIFHWNIIPEPTFEAELHDESLVQLLLGQSPFEVAPRAPEPWDYGEAI